MDNNEPEIDWDSFAVQGAVAEAYRDSDMGITSLRPTTVDRIRQLRDWAAEEVAFIRRASAGASPFVAGYVSGINAAVADFEYTVQYERRQGYAYWVTLRDFYGSGVTMERLRLIFGADEVKARGFREGYWAVIAHLAPNARRPL